MLCDDVTTLFELKARFATEAANYHTAAAKLEQYTTLQEELHKISYPNFRNLDKEEFYQSKIDG